MNMVEEFCSECIEEDILNDMLPSCNRTCPIWRKSEREELLCEPLTENQLQKLIDYFTTQE
jgi:hypothetical protein